MVGKPPKLLTDNYSGDAVPQLAARQQLLAARTPLADRLGYPAPLIRMFEGALVVGAALISL